MLSRRTVHGIAGNVNLIEALEAIKQQSSDDASVFTAFLACGFTPLHLQTFLAAHLKGGFPEQEVEIKTGLFGDLAGNIERVRDSRSEALAAVIEWQDLDPRLGIRSWGGWRTQDLRDIVQSAERAIARLDRTLRQASAFMPVCICLPTLPLPPLFTAQTQEAGMYELQLRKSVAEFAASVAAEPHLRVLSSQRLDEISPLHARLDLRSELTAGFPYKLPHASAIAELLARLIQNPTAKKGLITDLDGTLWAGVLGEVGPEEVSWTLDGQTQMHGLYQRFLESLASAGILIGIASKNDPALVEQALQRRDLILAKENAHPVEAYWGPKSQSVRRILKKWNIGAADVVFIDDSPLEGAEVKAAFPEMECLLFPQNDYQGIWELLKQLRDLFGKNAVSNEDAIRLMNIREAEPLQDSIDAGSLDGFLKQARATIRFSFGKRAAESRAFELLSKTNQFNLNGKRLTEAGWLDYLRRPETFLMTVDYEDKFGPLGKIAVLLGKAERSAVLVEYWVMSCRAFSRRIEHQSLKELFEKFSVEQIYFDYGETSRNGPLREFLGSFVDVPLSAQLRISKSSFSEKAPPLFHHVEEVNHG